MRIYACLVLVFTWILAAIPVFAGGVTVQNKPGEQLVEVTINDVLFTRYLYNKDLKKPILYPVRTATGKDAQRHYPVEPALPNEQKDHPHHQSITFTYGDIDGVDFWSNQNTNASIRHQRVLEARGNGGSGRLVVDCDWVLESGETTLKEHRSMTFRGDDHRRIIDFDIDLTAANGPVVFRDTKEGMFAFRVATEMQTVEGGTAEYLNAEGLKGESECWGKRSKWVALRGRLKDEPTDIVIMHHPSSVQYPTYWHARGYGLFAANPFGVKDFIKGSEPLNYTLQKNQSAKFGFRILIYSGKILPPQDIEAEYTTYLKDTEEKH